jgi:membrane protein involved in colicin uptake
MLFGASFSTYIKTLKMSKNTYTFDGLMEKKAKELKEICDGLEISNDGNKTELSNRILAEEARLKAEANLTPEEREAKAKEEAEAKAKEEAEAKAKEEAEAKAKEEAEAKAKEEAEAKAKEEAEAEQVIYTLPEKSVGVLDTNGKKYTREEALKNQPLLAKLKKLGHRGIKIKK